jgi:hypothetical protein
MSARGCKKSAKQTGSPSQELDATESDSMRPRTTITTTLIGEGFSRNASQPAVLASFFLRRRMSLVTAKAPQADRLRGLPSSQRARLDSNQRPTA